MPNSKDIFPFFELPGELRDSIYEYSIIQRALVQGQGKRLRLFVINKLIGASLLVSRLFMTEYSERVPKGSSLAFEHYSGRRQDHPTIPTILRGYPLSQITLAVFSFHCIEDHAERLEVMRHKTSSKGVLIKPRVSNIISRAKIETMTGVLGGVRRSQHWSYSL